MLFPKEKKFYGFFEHQVHYLDKASILFKRMLSEPEKIEEIAKEMKSLEHEADCIGHETIRVLHKSFITPIERDDINLLRQNLDDIMDGIEMATNRILIYNIAVQGLFADKISHYLKIICEAISEIKKGVEGIRNLNDT